MCGRKRVHIASMRNVPRARAASTSDRASAASIVNGFSTSTALPASIASIAASWWHRVRCRDVDRVDVRVGGEVGVGRSARCAMPKRLANASGAAGAARSDRHDLVRRSSSADRRRRLVGDAAGADHAPADAVGRRTRCLLGFSLHAPHPTRPRAAGAPSWLAQSRARAWTRVADSGTCTPIGSPTVVRTSPRDLDGCVVPGRVVLARVAVRTREHDPLDAIAARRVEPDQPCRHRASSRRWSSSWA